MNNLTVKELATILNSSDRHIQRLTKDNILVRNANNKYDLAASLQNYISYITNKHQNQKPTHDSINPNYEKGRLLRAKASIAELEEQQLKGTLIKAAGVEESWASLIMNFRAKILSIPTKLARPLALLGSDIRKIEALLHDECYAALTELSNSNFDNITTQDSANSHATQS